MRDQSGQTTAEYAALLTLVAAALAAAGAALGLGEVAAAVGSTVRTGICIVAGDVCRASDAAAAGLAPCTVAERSRGEGLTFTVASLRLGADDGWTATTRSDGSVTVTNAEGRTVGGTVGVGLEASPLGLEVGVDGELDYRFGSGRAWEFEDMDAALRFLTSPDRDEVEPTWRFGEAGAVAGGDAHAGVAGVELTGFESTAQAAGGMREGRGLTTYYVRSRLAMLDGWGPDLGVEGPPALEAVVELTRDAGGMRELAFRTVEHGARGGQMVETVARLDLLDPTHRAAAEPLLALPLPWPPAAARELRTLVRRAVRAGVVERSVFDVRDDSQALKLAAKLGLALGVDGEEVDVERRLVSASAWTQGSGERERADCLPE